MSMQSYNVGADGDMLSINSYGSADCAGDATTVVDGGVWVTSRWHQSRAYYRSYLDDTEMCDHSSLSLNDADGMQLGCCNVVLKYGKECAEDPVDPVDPVDPIDCGDPVDPVDPVDPDDYIDPDAPVEPTPTCTFSDDLDLIGWSCNDGTECFLDEIAGITTDENDVEGCDSTCAPTMKDADDMDCTPGGRRLAVQTKIAFGQN